MNSQLLTLSASLGWAEGELLKVAKGDPELALQLLTASKPRLHFMGFVLAMTAPPASRNLVHDALSLPMREVLLRLGLSSLRGVRRVLGRIQGRVLEREQYRQIASLLAESTTAQVLHHASEVTPELLANLSTLPLMLRSHVIADAIGHVPNAAAHLVEWIEIVAARVPKLSVKNGEVLTAGIKTNNLPDMSGANGVDMPSWDYGRTVHYTARTADQAAAALNMRLAHEAKGTKP